MVVSYVLLIVCVFVLVPTYLCTVATYGELLAYQAVLQEHQTAIADTKDAVVLLFGVDADAASQLLSVENLKHSTNIAERIKENETWLYGMKRRHRDIACCYLVG